MLNKILDRIASYQSRKVEFDTWQLRQFKSR